MAIDTQAMQNLLHAILEDRAQVWVYYPNHDATDKGLPVSITVTAIWHEPISKARYLFIYAHTALTTITAEQYEHGLNTLREFAKARNCSQVLAYIDNDTYVGLLGKVGGRKITNLVRF